MDNVYDEAACEATHKSIETRFISFNWIIGIVISLQLACFTFTAYLAAKVAAIDCDRAVINEKINTVLHQQIDLKTTIIANQDKILDLVKKIDEDKKK
jgi:hypothetical protein